MHIHPSQEKKVQDKKAKADCSFQSERQASHEIIKETPQKRISSVQTLSHSENSDPPDSHCRALIFPQSHVEEAQQHKNQVRDLKTSLACSLSFSNPYLHLGGKSVCTKLSKISTRGSKLRARLQPFVCRVIVSSCFLNPSSAAARMDGPKLL